ncbi:PTS sugar transporter subunit IIA [Celerinatantimonas diazotrophica]|uniref:PTS system IIA component (L-Asc family) n=1 Tax=Celerinatantimonas diazotrophica TaxID=412034 RepID=A0A4V2PRF0_9GAMM|nr:PTS sugar transporter subunit IIA [Celerinatantimonas diazotrophica]TCK58601.1 PTS system IIA component (L-Asc family) [Celerinatantimonas diazotrophica]CAG9297230.1 Ascorbate-specific PTS system EIIA component [Celerinatantimonas diazotrophica]
MLTSILPKSRIVLIDSVTDWQDAVNLSLQPLLDDGCINESYKQAIFRMHHEIGPYYVLGPKIALLHARPEDGVNQLSLGMTIIRDGVCFGSEDNDPVYLIVTLAATDKNSHIDIIASVSELFLNEEDINQLIKCKEVNEVYSIIKKY